MRILCGTDIPPKSEAAIDRAGMAADDSISLQLPANLACYEIATLEACRRRPFCVGSGVIAPT